MRDPVFDSDDLGAAAAFLADAYPGVRFGEVDADGGGQWRRDLLGPVTVDRVSLGGDLGFGAVLGDVVCVVGVHSGGITWHGPGGAGDFLAPGQVGLLVAGDGPCSGVLRAGRYTLMGFDRGLLDRVSSIGEPSARLVGRMSRTPAAGRRLGAVLTHLRQLAATVIAEDRLVAATAANYLAATVTTTLPVAQIGGSGPVDHGDRLPGPVRHAVDYLETHVRGQVTLADVAAAAFVTPRALQLAFRRHLDTTPLGYLRQLRLAGAHEQLLASIPGDGQTVAAVARSWGFAHPGRFAALYHRHYLCAPAETRAATAAPTNGTDIGARAESGRAGQSKTGADRPLSGLVSLPRV